MIKMKNLLIAALAIWILLAAQSCRRSDNDLNRIPDVPVNEVVNLDLPTYFNLQIPGNFIYLNAGARGIILIHAYDGEFYALDRNCSFEPFRDCAQLWVDSTTIFQAKCGIFNNGTFESCCSSTFDLVGGFPINGPANRPLKPYFVTRQGNTLFISN